MKKSRALIIAPYPFYPPDNGGKIVIYNSVLGLSEYFDLHVVIPDPYLQQDKDGLEFLKKTLTIHTAKTCPAFEKPESAFGVRLQKVFRSSILKYPIVNIYDFYRDADVLDLIHRDFAFIQLNHASWYHPALRQRKSKLVLIAHNCEFEYFSEMGKALIGQRRFAQGLKYILGSRKILAQEKEAICDADAIIALSERDKHILTNYFGREKDIYVLKPRLDIARYATWPQPSKTETGKKFNSPNLVFVGSLNLAQNTHGVLFFVDQVMPKLRRAGIAPKLYLVGKDPLSILKKKVRNNPAIILTGSVEDVRPYIAQADIYIAPLFHGSGVRLKIIEAMAMGKAIVATKKAIEGLGVENCGIVTANTADEFARAILNLSTDESLRERYAKINKDHAQRHFDSRDCANEALSLYEKFQRE